MKNSCIILEGGGLRGAFTGGVLEYFLEKELNFDRVIGVSAGACTGASYLSKQKGRNRKINVEYPSDKRYMGFRHLITSGSYFNMKFIFGEIPNRLVPFDEKAFFKNRAEFDILTTSLNTGNSVVFSKKEIENIGVDKALVASSSIPLLSQPVNIEGQLFLDGGVSDSIPVRYALSKHSKAVVILTRPRGYRKEKLSNQLIFKLAFRKHPEFLETLLKRNEEYNKTLDFCDQMEREGKLFIIAPSPEFSIGRTEKSFQKRESLYNHGYTLIQSVFENLQLFLNQDAIH
ncbi:MAG: patatin family protein [Bacteroidia bacterium]|nr:patatin family protein [Bacteroidia bacterium]